MNFRHMKRRRLLLLSNSTNHGGSFLSHAEPALPAFLGDGSREVLFVPYAGVRVSFDAYEAKVAERFEALGYTIRSIHRAADPLAAVADAQAIAVGGGNTFQLLTRLAGAGLLEAIRARVHDGMPYVGWSAGSNLACPTIMTTNDMPIAEPPNFDALDLVPFQINPHYTDAVTPEHGGETRDDRLLEFVTANPAMPVLGLREGSMLRLEDGVLTLLGEYPARVFRYRRDAYAVTPGASLQFLLG